jgi:hypothetical protein
MLVLFQQPQSRCLIRQLTGSILPDHTVLRAGMQTLHRRHTTGNRLRKWMGVVGHGLFLTLSTPKPWWQFRIFPTITVLNTVAGRLPSPIFVPIGAFCHPQFLCQLEHFAIPNFCANWSMLPNGVHSLRGHTTGIRLSNWMGVVVYF